MDAVEIERLCEVMHDAYEAASIVHGWETQMRSRKPWSMVPEANKATMRESVTALLDAVGYDTLRAERDELRGDCVDPEDIHAQRAAGWPDFHPETYCHRCGARNVESWSVDSALWNEATESIPRGMATILCPQCFTQLWEAATGRGVTWVLSPDPDTMGSARAALDRGTP